MGVPKAPHRSPTYVTRTASVCHTLAPDTPLYSSPQGSHQRTAALREKSSPSERPGGVQTPPAPSQLGEARSGHSPSWSLSSLGPSQEQTTNQIHFNFFFNFKRAHLQAIQNLAGGPECSNKRSGQQGAHVRLMRGPHHCPRWPSSLLPASRAVSAPAPRPRSQSECVLPEACD